ATRRAPLATPVRIVAGPAGPSSTRRPRGRHPLGTSVAGRHNRAVRPSPVPSEVPLMRYAALGLLLAVIALPSAPPAPLPDPKPAEEPLADKVKKAIERGVEFLRNQEEGRGDLEKNTVSRLFTGGWTALGALALLNAGVPPDDAMMERLLKYLRTVEPTQTY